MRCPFCGSFATGVKDSRPWEEGAAIRRRRYCGDCASRFTTVERIQLRDLMVLKKDGRQEAFSREKIRRALALALHKRSVSQEKIERVVSSLVRQFETSGEGEIATKFIGERVMEVLASLDAVGYIRFASIYKDFSSGKDFAEVAKDFEAKDVEELSKEGGSDGF